MNKLAIFLSVPLRKYDRLRKAGNLEQGFEVRSGNYIASLYCAKLPYTISTFLI